MDLHDDMTEEQLDAAIDVAIERDFRPGAWAKQTDRVIDAYKNEVERMRKDMRGFVAALSAIQRTIAELKQLQAESSKLLQEMKEGEIK